MIDIGKHSLFLGIELRAAPDWIHPVLDLGRDAAFVDTGYLRALIDDTDAKHKQAEDHLRLTKANMYTSPLVLAELVRQMAKKKYQNQNWRWERVHNTKVLFVDDRRLVVCIPPRDLVMSALLELDQVQHSFKGLDLCDVVSAAILDRARHRRVFGFDCDLLYFGASLEP